MERDPRINPEPGDWVASSYKAIPDRTVLAVSACNVRYRTVQGARSVERDCLPHTWVKWCRAHRAQVIS